MPKKNRKTLPTPNINEFMTIATLRHYASVFSQCANFLEATMKVGNGVTAARTGPARVLSTAGRRKIAKAQKNRWAKNRGATNSPGVVTMGKGKTQAAAA